MIESDRNSGATVTVKEKARILWNDGWGGFRIHGIGRIRLVYGVGKRIIVKASKQHYAGLDIHIWVSSTLGKFFI